MIILKKKKIRIAILSVFAISLPVSGKTIVIDAGHGKPDEGEYLLH